MAQLGSIESTALADANLATAREVAARWAAPGGPGPGSWSVVAGVGQLLGRAGLDAQGSVTSSFTPTLGQVKATDGPDWVVACVGGVLTAAAQDAAAQVAIADCQRMVWRGGRWVLGPGAEPAAPAAVWPGTPASHADGWQELRHG